MKQQYINKRFNRSSIELIEVMGDICADYAAQGFVLTVRQLYYQLVARGIIPNTLNDYKRTASMLNDARLAGLIDWDAIEDRTREFIRRSRWASGSHAMRSIAQQFHMDMWEGQETRVFVLVEKEALTGVLEPVCTEFDIPLLAARGYPSVSVVREFVNSDLADATASEQNVLILHLGDHDPSGIDMTRDIIDRVELFASDDCDYSECIEVRRIALNMHQVEELRPPENPAKTTDARFVKYRKKFGTKSWELDALSPEYIDNLVRTEVEAVIDYGTWSQRIQKIEDIRDRMNKIADKFKD